MYCSVVYQVINWDIVVFFVFLPPPLSDCLFSLFSSSFLFLLSPTCTVTGFHLLSLFLLSLSFFFSLSLSDIPVITHSSSSVFSLVGETVILQCMFNGLPRPTLVWRYKDQVISGNSSNHSITNDGTLLISGVGLADAGQYYCSVSNGLGSDNIVTSLHVQGKGGGREREREFMEI